jgi:hypothetical protein
MSKRSMLSTISIVVCIKSRTRSDRSPPILYHWQSIQATAGLDALVSLLRDLFVVVRVEASFARG